MPKKNPKHIPKASNLTLSPRLKKRPIPEASTKKPLSKTCQIKGCTKESIHTLSLTEYEPSIKKMGLTIKAQKGARRFNICKDHYKDVKKARKKDEKYSKPQFESRSQKMPKREKIQSFLE